MNEHQYYVYLMSNKRNGTLYIGVTNDIVRRIYEHKMDVFEGFTKKYALHMLVYYEFGGDVSSAIAREKQLKNWKRAWKIELIESANPSWDDLSRYFMDCGSAPAMTVASPAMTVAAPSITTL